MSEPFAYSKNLGHSSPRPIIGIVPQDAFASAAKGRTHIDGDCHIWTGRKTPRGYGVWAYKGGYYLTHRLAYAFHYGRDLTLCGCHKCDNPACFNPEHIWEGSYRDNARDMYSKGRNTRIRAIGEGVASSKLTLDQAIAAFTDKRPAAHVARDFGVTPSIISAIRNGRSWVKTLAAAGYHIHPLDQ